MIQIYEKHPLTLKAITFINESNPSNNAPYHGIDHLFEVFKFSYTIFENDTLCKSIKINKLELLIACLFHDYNHSTGRLKDSENISNAIDGLTEFHKIYPEFDLEISKDIIRATEYPYTLPDEGLTIEQQIIRDSDMCYLFNDISIVKLYQGLRTEFNQNLDDFLSNQSKFLDNVQFYTEKCQQMWSYSYKDVRKKELEMLIKNQ
jgi:hypothetical protein